MKHTSIGRIFGILLLAFSFIVIPASAGTLKDSEIYSKLATRSSCINVLAAKKVPLTLVDFPFREGWSELIALEVLDIPDFINWKELSKNEKMFWGGRVFLAYQMTDFLFKYHSLIVKEKFAECWREIQKIKYQQELTQNNLDKFEKYVLDRIEKLEHRVTKLEKKAPPKDGINGINGIRGYKRFPGKGEPKCFEYYGYKVLDFDEYVDENTSNIWFFLNNCWVYSRCEKGNDGPRGSFIFTGAGEPKSFEYEGFAVQKLDIYIDTNCKNLYQFDGKTWQAKGCLKGDTGPRGIAGLNGIDGITKIIHVKPKPDRKPAKPTIPVKSQEIIGQSASAPATQQGIQHEQSAKSGNFSPNALATGGNVQVSFFGLPFPPATPGWNFERKSSEVPSLPAWPIIQDTRNYSFDSTLIRSERSLFGLTIFPDICNKCGGNHSPNTCPTNGQAPTPPPPGAANSGGNPSGPIFTPPGSDVHQPGPQPDNGTSGQPWQPTPGFGFMQQQ